MLMRGSRVTWLMARSSHFHFVPDRFIFIGSSYRRAARAQVAVIIELVFHSLF